MSLLKAGRPSKKEKAIASVQDNKEATIRMNVNIPKSFYKQIKQHALNQDTTITDLVLIALKSHISK